MRSKLGTKARLAAHITAAILLILMLVYLVDAPQRPAERWSPGSIRPAATAVAPAEAATMDQIAIADRQTPIPGEQLRPPLPEPVRESPEHRETAKTPDQPAPPPAPPEREKAETPLSPGQHVPAPEPPAEAKTGESAEKAAPEPEPAPAAESAPAPEPVHAVESASTAAPAAAHAPAPAPEPAPAAESKPEPVTPPAEAPGAADAETPAAREEPQTPAQPEAEAETPTETPPSAQPDESGSLVVAAPETGADGPVAATAPLANANLEVLGDGVYWLDPRHDLERELAAIPEVGSLILLTPLPGYRVGGFEHVKTVAIPADSGDLTLDAVEHFLHVAAESRHPVVAAALPGARGAAYFKGAYLLLKRNMDLPDVLRKVAPELEEAGEAREEIEHRLSNLAAK